MNVWVITYRFNNQDRTIIQENDLHDVADVIKGVHPSIATKLVDVEFVGTLA
jgi:hypothetical protein